MQTDRSTQVPASSSGVPSIDDGGEDSKHEGVSLVTPGGVARPPPTSLMSVSKLVIRPGISIPEDDARPAHLEPDDRDRIKRAYYPAGHMMYVHDPSRLKLDRDLEGFYERTLAPKAP